ncbi:MAG: PIG-L deacetylase family protein [Planctomycetota bacterium]|jgi:LmbE family N-acetylglucosaminyl deacetylase
MSKFNRSLLIVHAHPDDTEAFSAGMVSLLKEKGWTITIATMTAGGMGGINSTEEDTIAQRKEEAKKAAAVLDAEYVCFDQRDGYVFDNEAVRIATTALIRRVGAGVVLTHLPFDYHTDHRTTSNITESAAMLATLPNVPCEEEPLEITPLLYHSAPLGFSDPLGEPITPPHFFVDIKTSIKTKMEMLAFHESQIELMAVMHKMPNFFEEMEKYNRELGEEAGVEVAECYWQHLGGGFQKDNLIQEELKEYIITK